MSNTFRPAVRPAPPAARVAELAATAVVQPSAEPAAAAVQNPDTAAIIAELAGLAAAGAALNAEALARVTAALNGAQKAEPVLDPANAPRVRGQIAGQGTAYRLRAVRKFDSRTGAEVVDLQPVIITTSAKGYGVNPWAPGLRGCRVENAEAAAANMLAAGKLLAAAAAKLNDEAKKARERGEELILDSYTEAQLKEHPWA